MPPRIRVVANSAVLFRYAGYWRSQGAMAIFACQHGPAGCANRAKSGNLGALSVVRHDHAPNCNPFRKWEPGGRTLRAW